MHPVRIYAIGASLLTLAACSDPVPPPSAQREEVKPVQTVAVDQTPVVAAPVPIVASLEPAGLAIDKITFAMAPSDTKAQEQMLIRAQVLLDRAHFSPGVIDGKTGGNMRQAIRAYQTSRGLPLTSELDEATWNSLVASDTAPIMTDYQITAEDVKGPFLKEIPKDYAEQAKLTKLGFTTPAEMLAERFHMDEKLLRALNPGADFSAADTRILVVAPRNTPLAKVARIEVDKGERILRAYDAGDKLIAVYPATVGSSDLPTPAGTWAVNTVAPNPTYTYDPSRLNFGKKEQGKLTLQPGPNNPVGVAWIDLTKDTYGIHGGPDPTRIGKTDSHGCVRLTNWDVAELAKAVSKGVKVAFVGAERGSASAD